MRLTYFWAGFSAGVWLLALPNPGVCAVVHGKVQMEDGASPNRTIAIERYCETGARQVGMADHKGLFVLSMDINPLSDVSCVLRAVLDGYESTNIEISSFGWFSDPNLPPIVLRRRGQGSVSNDAAVFDQGGVPVQATVAWAGATRAARVNNWEQAERQLRSVVQSAPRFAQGWYGLGLARMHLHQAQPAQEALRKAVELNQKNLDAYLLLARAGNEARDWPAAAEAAETLIRKDTGKHFPEVYSHLAMARYQLKDLDGAQASIEDGIRLDKQREFFRNEFILGVILMAKHNRDEAREHLSKFLQLAPRAPESDSVRNLLANLDRAGATQDALSMEPPREEPVTAGGEAWVPGGIKALSAIAHVDPVPSNADFFSRYCRVIANETTIGTSRGIPDYAPTVQAYLAAIVALTPLGERRDNRTVITLSVATEEARRQTERVLPWLGWRLIKTKDGMYSTEPGTQVIDAQRQAIPSALGIDEISLQEAIEAGRQYSFEIVTESARFTGGDAWSGLFRVPSALPPGGIAAALTLDIRLAKSCTGLGAMGPETAAIVMSTAGLGNLVTRHSDVLARYGEAFKVSDTGVVTPGGREAELAWQKLAGARSTDTPAFLRALLEKQEGKLAAFYFALWKADAAHQRFFTKTPQRAERFFAWYREGDEFRFGVSRRVDGWRTEFFQRLPLDENGNVRFPGGKSAWSSGAASDEEILLSSKEIEALVPLADLEERRGAALDQASAHLLAKYYPDWHPLFPYFARLRTLGADEFRALAGFAEGAAAYPPAEQNTLLGEWFSLVDLIDRGVKSGALDGPAAGSAFRRVSVERLTPDHAARAIKALRELSGGGNNLSESVASNLLRLTGARRDAFDTVLRLQDMAGVETPEGRGAAQAALTGYVYAAVLDPDTLLLNEDRHLLSKHRFVTAAPRSKAPLAFASSSLVSPGDSSGAYLSGGFVDFEEVARRLPRAAPIGTAQATGKPAESASTPATSPVTEASSTEVDFRATSRLVEVYATVKDARGRYIDNLTLDQFSVLDQDPQRIAGFESQGSDISCALLLDTTGSMQKALPSLKAAALKLIGDLRPADSVAVYSFDESVTGLQALTTDKTAAKRAILRARAQGQTALYDALTQVTHDLAGRPGKKVIVLFTDGKDNASTLTAESAITRAKAAGIPIYTIAEGEAVSEPVLVGQLAGISKASGGESFVVQNAGEIGRVLEKVSEDLAHGYLLSFAPPQAENNEWRTIEVTVHTKGARVHAREGYYPQSGTE